MVLFFIPFAAFHDAVDADGTDLVGHKAFGLAVSSILIVAVTLRVSPTCTLVSIKHNIKSI